MTSSTYTCQCGARLRYRQDMERRPGGRHANWVCGDCGLPVPGGIAQRLRHQHPS